MSKQQQKELKQSVTPFAQPNIKTSIIQIINSILPFFVIWFLAYQSIAVSLWLTIPLTIAAAGFAVRIFIIFHDCAHDSFFEKKKTNQIVGTITGIITHFAFAKWKKTHAMHHATSGNLDKRGTGDIWMMTVEEYAAASRWKKITYRLYRNPFVMFGLGPFFLFLLENRFNDKTAKKSEKRNTYLINGSIAAIYALLIWVIGWQAFLIVQLPVLYVSGALGIWLFYVQHQFEDSYFENEERWNFVKAAVDGSSYYKLPKIMQWLSGNIGFHHVHHLSPRVPNYNLEKTHEQVTPLQQVTTITLWSSLQSIRFRLYDEDNKRFVNFREMKYLMKQKNHQYN
ncbi:fatty acid desaturase [Salibacterium lacus]|uniref:Fatty acid desaturase n=1 Tax=Salibacterium lacus TaxID=1898109 RepID=A0ABW5T1Y7_9BACI